VTVVDYPHLLSTAPPLTPPHTNVIYFFPHTLTNTQVAHAPGLSLSESLLQGPLGRGWASRVFFSDDGSTAVEVALKMAFRKYLVDHGLAGDIKEGGPIQLEVRGWGLGWDCG